MFELITEQSEEMLILRSNCVYFIGCTSKAKDFSYSVVFFGPICFKFIDSG